MYGIMADWDMCRDAIVFYDGRGKKPGEEAKRGLVLPYEALSRLDMENVMSEPLNRIKELKRLIEVETEKLLVTMEICIPDEGKPIKVTLPNGEVYEGEMAGSG